MWWNSLLLVVCVACASASEDRESRLVNTAQGPVRGYKDPDYDVFTFHGIPYASAPTGPHRFKAPLPPPLRLTALEAVDRGIICPQGILKPSLILNKTLQEDCLIANIYAPDTEETNLPVVVYVHGGGFQIGYGNMLTIKTLVKTKKIVAVSFNYRLGVHGFLCLGTEDAPGNAGMKDQVALLRWVKKNIGNFGGNPNDITIDGYSAGSSSVELLMLSKTTQGLINKVIPESGASVGVWSVQIDPLENAKRYAKSLNFTNVDDVYALGEFYKTAPYELLFSDTFMDRIDSSFIFSPCVERDTGVERFLQEAPADILKQGKYMKVPLLYGFANMEGLLRIPLYQHWKDRMNDKFSDFLPADLQFESDEQKEDVAKSIKEFYFGDKPVGIETLVGYIDYFTDTMFAYPTLRSVKLQVEAGSDSIYLYEYSYVDNEKKNIKSELDFGTGFMNIDFDGIHGANHCGQTWAITDTDLFGTPEELSSDKTKKHRALMRELWLNFITTGKPVPAGSSLPAWPPAGADMSPHMSLDVTMQLRGPLLERRFRFWDDIYERHYRTPTSPPPPPQIHYEL